MDTGEEVPPPNRVAELFADKTVLITGGTGFLGKLLIEKLLRTTALKKIYAIARPKNGKSVEERLEEMLNGPIFDVIKKDNGDEILKKIEVVRGDLSELGLGLNEEDRKKLCEETEIIYHSAASVKFDESLKSMVLLNVRGTKLMLDLAKECKKLKVFCYISSSYCHETEDILYDNTVYAPPADPHKILKVSECLNGETLDLIARNLRGTSTNNYTFTKALGEDLVYQQMKNLPSIVQRSTCALPTWREPIPGWTDSLNGPIGLVVAGGTGILRTMFAKDDICIDCMPADVLINMLICSTYDYLAYGTRRVYNITVSKEFKITPKEVVTMGMEIITEKIPPSKILWYPNITFTKSRFLHYVYFFLFQFLPAIIIDCVLVLIRIHPFLVRIQKKVWNSYKIFEYFANREWDFRHDNLKIMRTLLNSTEREVFKIDSKDFDFYEYLVECVKSGRVYILRGKHEDIASDLIKIKLLKYLNIFCKTLFYGGLFFCIVKLVTAA